DADRPGGLTLSCSAQCTATARRFLANTSVATTWIRVSDRLDKPYPGVIKQLDADVAAIRPGPRPGLSASRSTLPRSDTTASLSRPSTF
ncbi:MAG: hypothetical protein K5905_21555, partial [Roseibium sp.]|uniref:hypothetical protein n=1 Tax=Roseibium sp. TaxID=1936156 RepID=UPI0026165B6A